jgi:hypothetical protein
VIARPELDRLLADLDALYAPMRATFSPRAAAVLGSRGG